MKKVEQKQRKGEQTAFSVARESRFWSTGSVELTLAVFRQGSRNFLLPAKAVS